MDSDVLAIEFSDNLISERQLTFLRISAPYSTVINYSCNR